MRRLALVGRPKGYIGPLLAAVMRRGELVAGAELAWHAELEEQLAELRAAGANPEHGRMPGAQPGALPGQAASGPAISGPAITRPADSGPPRPDHAGDE